MAAPLVIFKSINAGMPQQALLQQLLADQTPVYLKMPDEKDLELIPMSINHALLIKCQYSGSQFVEDVPCSLMMNFMLNNERYMADVEARMKGALLTLEIKNLFHLQRRRNFRYILPPNHPGFFNLKSAGQDMQRVSMRLIDISTEGCAAETSQENLALTVGQELVGEIVLEGQKSILITALLQNMRPTDDQRLTLGLRFLHTAQNREGDIVQAITLLQRSIFMKRSA